MIEYRTGDILKTDAEALVNTVNCVGIMGRGIALQFKNAFPENFKAYAAACRRDEVRPGRMFVFETRTITNPKYIINFPTKRHWRGKSWIEDIEVGLIALAHEIRARHIRSIAIPPLGSGLGGLNWRDVRQRIGAALHEFNGVDVIVFELSGAPDTKPMARSRDVPNMTAGPGRAGRPDEPVPGRANGPVRVVTGGSQTPVFHAGEGRTSKPEIRPRCVRSICRESEPCACTYRRALCFRIC